MDGARRDPISAGPIGLLVTEFSIPEGLRILLRPFLRHHVAALHEIAALREAPEAAEEVPGHLDPAVEGNGSIAVVVA